MPTLTATLQDYLSEFGESQESDVIQAFIRKWGDDVPGSRSEIPDKCILARVFDKASKEGDTQLLTFFCERYSWGGIRQEFSCHKRDEYVEHSKESLHKLLKEKNLRALEDKIANIKDVLLGADPQSYYKIINSIDAQNKTLMCQAAMNFPSGISLLYDSGADINMMSFDKSSCKHIYGTPLHYAIMHGNQVSVQQLIELGANLSDVMIWGHGPTVINNRGESKDVVAFVNYICNDTRFEDQKESITACLLALSPEYLKAHGHKGGFSEQSDDTRCEVESGPPHEVYHALGINSYEDRTIYSTIEAARTGGAKEVTIAGISLTMEEIENFGG